MVPTLLLNRARERVAVFVHRARVRSRMLRKHTIEEREIAVIEMAAQELSVERLRERTGHFVARVEAPNLFVHHRVPSVGFRRPNEVADEHRATGPLETNFPAIADRTLERTTRERAITISLCFHGFTLQRRTEGGEPL